MSERSQRITEKAISSAQLDVIISQRPMILWCKQFRGFGVRVAPPGKKYPLGKVSYLVQKHQAGRKSKEIRFTFGEYPTLPLVEAYNKAILFLAQIRNGENPSQDRKSLFEQRKEEYQASKTNKFSIVFESYRQAKIKEKGESLYFSKHIVNNFNKYVLPLIGNKSLPQITKEDMRALLSAINKLPTRRVIHAQLSPIFSYAVSEEIITLNPMEGIKLPAPSKPRERILSKEELKAFWLATGEMMQSPKPVVGCMLRALLFSACRLNEIAGLEFSEISDDKSLITIQAKRMKNRKAFIVPVTTQLNSVLVVTPKKSNQYVFSYGKKPVVSFSRAKLILDEGMQKHLKRELEPFVLHTIRHTFNSVMASRGHDLDHIDLCLSHKVLRGQQNTYNHYLFAKEKRAVLEDWANYILDCIK